MDSTDLEYEGHRGRIAARRWSDDRADYVVLLVHGYGEHLGRYRWVAEQLVRDGAVVYANDHVGHGRSEGERVLIDDFGPVVNDVHLLEARARNEYPRTPIVLIGHSLGGMIAARYAQRYGDGLACVILSAPVIGSWATVDTLLAAEEIPDDPIDPATLSRDPAVGAAYEADPLVWHGPFRRRTLVGIRECLEVIRLGGSVDTPILWLHGGADRLVPLEGSRLGWADLAGRHAEARTYPGARHEIFNETNRDEVIADVTGFVHAHLPARDPAAS